MSEKFDDIIEKVEKLSVLELSELVKAMEDKFGVSAAMPVAASGAAAGGGEAGGEEKTVFTVELTSAGDQKIQVIKMLREAVGLGLKEAKDLADGAPRIVKEGMSKKDAEDLKARLEAAGAKVELK